MPEYLGPRTYIEEVSFRSKSIEGVSTTTTGFVGPTRYGPIDLPLELVASLGDFKRIYGDGSQLHFASGGNTVTLHNFMWHGARAFFTEGGKRLYVSRIFLRRDGAAYTGYDAAQALNAVGSEDSPYPDGHARARLLPSAATGQSLRIYSRWPGEAGNVRVRFTVTVGQNVLSFDRNTGAAKVAALLARDVVLMTRPTSPPTQTFALADFDNAAQTWTFSAGGSPPSTLRLSDLPAGTTLQVVGVNVTVTPDGLGVPEVWPGLALDARHQTNGAADGVTYRFGWDATQPSRNADAPVVIAAESGVDNGLQLLNALFAAGPASTSPPAPGLRDNVLDPDAGDADRFVEVLLRGGNDGRRPGAAEYEGEADPGSTSKTGLKQFEDIDDISIVAGPGSTFGYESSTTQRDESDTVISHLLDHAFKMRYRIAVIDAGNGQTLSQVQKMRGKFDSTYGALYYPWVRVEDPVTRQIIYLPPSGFVTGIYARNDVTRAVYKAPANEVVNLSLGFEVLLSNAQQDILNPAGVNCFRFFEGRGYRLWGARTISSDPEWKYVNLRRYFAYLEHSIDKGTQWAVFEPNGEHLWGNIRRTIEEFLFNEFQSGALLGDKPEQAYFVKCDRSTMTQNDLDNGRLIVLVGVAPLKPAEFVIIRIGQWTADRKV